MKAYLAGASAELELCKHWRDRLRAAGVEITHDWIATIEAVGDANPADASREQRAKWADEDLDGVANADVFWLLMPPPGRGWGAGVELGYAVGRKDYGTHVTIVVSGDDSHTIFGGLAPHYFATHEEAFHHITGQRT